MWFNGYSLTLLFLIQTLPKLQLRNIKEVNLKDRSKQEINKISRMESNWKIVTEEQKCESLNICNYINKDRIKQALENVSKIYYFMYCIKKQINILPFHNNIYLNFII